MMVEQKHLHAILEHHSVFLQLNEDLLMDHLRDAGFSQAAAFDLVKNASQGWRIHVSDNEERAETLQVFRPGQVTPVITAPWETVYREVAKLWKKESGTPKSTPAQLPYTRQRQQAQAAMDRQLDTEGLSNIQMQQMRQTIAEALQPIAEEQQQQKLTMETMQEKNNRVEATMASDIKQIMLSAQQMAKHQQQLMLLASQPVPASAPSNITANPVRQLDIGTSTAAQAETMPATEPAAWSADLGQGLRLDLDLY